MQISLKICKKETVCEEKTIHNPLIINFNSYIVSTVLIKFLAEGKEIKYR